MNKPPFALLAGLLPLAAVAQPEAPAAEAAVPVIEVVRTPQATPALAETDEPVKLAPVVVTGEKLGRSLAETNSSVAIVTREDLKAGSDASMKDIVTQFANVVSADGDREIAIRGVPQGGIGGQGDTISVYLDGVALPSRAGAFAGPLSAWDLEQVEVLRGAQSTNQGRNSLAGSVVLRSIEPTAEWDARLRAGIMSRDGHDYAFAGGGPITDALRFRIAAQDRYDNGDVVNTTRNEDDAQRERTRNVRTRLAWTPQALPGYKALYGYTESDNEYGDPFHDSSGGERTETSNVRPNEDVTTKLHSLEQGYAFNPRWSLDAISGWSELSNLYTIDYDRSAADGGYSDNTEDEDILSQELRLRYSSPRFKAITGLYYADSDVVKKTIGYDVAAAGGVALLNGTIDSEANTRTAALFAEADWDFADAWRLTAGLRLNQERARRHDVSNLDLSVTTPPQLPLPIPVVLPLPDPLSDLLSTIASGTVPPDYDKQDRTRYTDLLPKAGLTWFVTDNSSLGLTYQEGYRSGGTSISFFGGAVSPYEPEYTKTVELSLRSRWLDERLTFNANLFYTRWRDQQVTIGETSGFSTYTENAGRSHYYGLETELLWKFQGPLEAFLTFGLLRSEFDEFGNDLNGNGATTDPEDEDYKGNEFPYAPRQTAGIGLTLKEWHRISGQVAANYVGSFYSDPDNDPQSRADARVLVNAKLGYALPAGFSLAVYGRNLTDELNDQGALVAGTRLASRYGEPRSFGAVLEWQME
ncbi:TonB-dependent receptor [Solimonas sp. SE-A11]|uniref:TonB-dependent receptor n=1 Tax=Solimonas sp. SE-A11 TaxID=3054954 RepID=UPI00259C7D1B|nr:TonB-dependent receptor [Solimonas sp. SE-A11]MDM4771047.1 TonB-dependent receptor [Solimonas sp. SE-A11]